MSKQEAQFCRLKPPQRNLSAVWGQSVAGADDADESDAQCTAEGAYRPPSRPMAGKVQLETLDGAITTPTKAAAPAAKVPESRPSTVNSATSDCVSLFPAGAQRADDFPSRNRRSSHR